MPYLVLISSMMLLLVGCSSTVDPADLSGHWKIDSVYRYYNRFEQHIAGKESDPTYLYLPGDKVREQKGEDYREYIFEWKMPDTLVYRAPEGQIIGTYQVLQLSTQQMVLKRQQPLIFPGSGQERYEIRYFSKMPPE
jgi:hypothetical protein